MKLAIMAMMPSAGYSGGRYFAWVMAEALAHTHNDVFFITNNEPAFSRDFETYPYHKHIKIRIIKDFSRCYKIYLDDAQALDYVVVVPHLTTDQYFFDVCRNLAVRTCARLILINFESANWFNQYSPDKREEILWKHWKGVCKDGCLVLSLAKEAIPYAKEFYNSYPAFTRFDYWYPPINSYAAEQLTGIKKEKQILLMVRLKDKHKGGQDILHLIDEGMEGYKLVFIAGKPDLNSDFINRLEECRINYHISYEFKTALSDHEKFLELSKSELLLFPSYFEGYGYPPIEALYCNTNCIAYDLPVLRETCGDAITYCRPGDTDQLKQLLKDVLHGQTQPTRTREKIFKQGSFDYRANSLNELLLHHLGDDWRNPDRALIPRCHWKNNKRYIKRRINPIHSVLESFMDQEASGKQTSAQSMREFKKACKKRAVILFGAGQVGTDFLYRYGRKFKIDKIIDNDKNKWGKKQAVICSRFFIFSESLQWLEIDSPAVLSDYDPESFVVLVANVKYDDEMTEQLKKMEVRYCYSFTKMQRSRMYYKLCYKMMKKGWIT